MVNPVNTSQTAIANPFTKQVDEQPKNQPRRNENDNKTQGGPRQVDESRESSRSSRQANAAQSNESQRRQSSDQGTQQRGSLVDLSV